MTANLICPGRRSSRQLSDRPRTDRPGMTRLTDNSLLGLVAYVCWNRPGVPRVSTRMLTLVRRYNPFVSLEDAAGAKRNVLLSRYGAF